MLVLQLALALGQLGPRGDGLVPRGGGVIGVRGSGLVGARGGGLIGARCGG